MLTCDEAEPELSAYLDGELNPQERAAVEAHMVLCAKCNDVLNEIEFARKSLVATPKLVVSDAFSARLKEAIRADALKASSVVRAPSSHAIRAVQQVYELAEFGEPPPLVPVPVRRVFPWSAVFSAIAAMLMVSLMGYVALAPSADQLALLTDKMANHAKGDSHARFADRAPSGEPIETPAKSAPPQPNAPEPAPFASTNAPELRSRENDSADAAPIRTSPAPKKERLEESIKRMADKQSDKKPDPSGELLAGKGTYFGGAPAAKKATDESPAPAAAPLRPAAPPKPAAALPPRPTPIGAGEPGNRSAYAPKPGAEINGADKSVMQKEVAGIGNARRLAADATLDLSDAKAGGPMVVRIRTGDLERSYGQLAQLSKAMNADLTPSSEAGKARTEFSLSALALKRTELLNALFAMQADGAKAAGVPNVKKDESGTGYKNAAPAEKSEKPTRGAAEKSKAVAGEKGDEKFTVKVELIAE